MGPSQVIYNRAKVREVQRRSGGHRFTTGATMHSRENSIATSPQSKKIGSDKKDSASHHDDHPSVDESRDDPTCWTKHESADFPISPLSMTQKTEEEHDRFATSSSKNDEADDDDKCRVPPPGGEEGIMDALASFGVASLNLNSLTTSIRQMPVEEQWKLVAHLVSALEVGAANEEEQVEKEDSTEPEMPSTDDDIFDDPYHTSDGSIQDYASCTSPAHGMTRRPRVAGTPDPIISVGGSSALYSSREEDDEEDDEDLLVEDDAEYMFNDPETYQSDIEEYEGNNRLQEKYHPSFLEENDDGQIEEIGQRKQRRSVRSELPPAHQQSSPSPRSLPSNKKQQFQRIPTQHASPSLLNVHSPRQLPPRRATNSPSAFSPRERRASGTPTSRNTRSHVQVQNSPRSRLDPDSDVEANRVTAPRYAMPTFASLLQARDASRVYPSGPMPPTGIPSPHRSNKNRRWSSGGGNAFAESPTQRRNVSRSVPSSPDHGGNSLIPQHLLQASAQARAYNARRRDPAGVKDAVVVEDDPTAPLRGDDDDMDRWLDEALKTQTTADDEDPNDHGFGDWA